MAGPILIELEIDPGSDLDEGLRRLIDAGEDLTPAMKEIAAHLEAATRLRFETQTDPEGRPWKPSERVKEHGGQTLTLTGDLRSSIGSRYDATSAEVGPERSFGAAVYAAIHQFGGVIRAVHKKALSFGGRVVAAVRIPARPYVGFTRDDPAAFAEILRGHFTSAWDGGAA
jgi:phage virion morphogenesis protein